MKFGALGLGLLLRSGTQLAVLILSSRFFSLEDIGIAALSFAAYHLIWTMFEIAAGQSFLQLDDTDHADTAALATLLFASMGGVLILVGLGLPMLMAIDPQSGVFAAGMIALLVVIRGTGTFSAYGMLRDLRIKRYALIEHGSYCVGMFAALALCVALDGGRIYLLLGLVLYSVLSIGGFILSAPNFPRPRLARAAMARMGRLASGFWIASGLNTFVREAGVLFIGLLIATEATAHYSRAFQLYMLGNFTVGQLFDRLLTPIFRKSRDDLASNKRLFEIATLVVLVFFVPAAVFLALEAQSVVALLFGPGWDTAVPVLQILCLGMTFRTGMKINEAVLRATGHVYTRVTYYVVWSVILCIGAIVAVPFGIVGFAVAEVVGVGVFWLLSLRKSLMLFEVPAKGILQAGALALICGAIAFGVHFIVTPLPDLARLLVEFFALTLIGAGATVLFAKHRFGSVSVLRALR